MAWFILACESGRERAIADFAKKSDIEVYFPLQRYYIQRPYRVKRKLREIMERPLMPGYLFVNSNRFSIFRSEYAPQGVFGFLGDAIEPKPVDLVYLDNLRRREAEGEFDTTSKRDFRHLPKGIRPGAPVRIIDGPLVALCGPIEGVISKIKNTLSILVECSAFGKPTTAKCALVWLKAI